MTLMAYAKQAADVVDGEILLCEVMGAVIAYEHKGYREIHLPGPETAQDWQEQCQRTLNNLQEAAG